MTYAERELQPLGFRTVSRKGENEIILSFDHLKLLFECVCPAYPSIKAMGCPLHHEGPGGSWPVDDAKKIVMTHSKNIRVEIESERATSRDPARVLIYENDKLVTEIIAENHLQEGADGGLYNCVTLKKKLRTSYLICIKSHCAFPDYENSCVASSKEEAAEIFKKDQALIEFSVDDLLQYIGEEEA